MCLFSSNLFNPMLFNMNNGGLMESLRSLLSIWHVLNYRRRWQLVGLQLLSLVAAAGEVANLASLLPVLQFLANPGEGIKVLGPLSSSLETLPEKYLLIILCLVFSLVVTLSTAIRTFTIRTQLRLTALITADLGDQVFASVMRKNYAWHLQRNSSNVLGYLTKDVDQANGSIQAILVIVVNLAIVVLLGGSLIALAPTVMPVISLILAGFYLVVYRYTRGSLRADGHKLTSNYQSSLQIAQEGLGGIRDVLIDQSQNFFQHTYHVHNRNYRLAGAAINTKAQVPRYLIEGFAVILIIGLALALALQGQGIDQQLPLLGTLALGAYRLLQPLQQCFTSVSGLQANQASINRLNPFLLDDKQIEKVLSSPSIKLQEKKETLPLVQLHNVSFKYVSSGPWVLQNLDLKVYSGERIAFVGSTGSGKTTTSDLILGLLAPTKGKLEILGHDLHAGEGILSFWQNHVSHVPQSIYLSDSNFSSNIAFGIPPHMIDLSRVEEAADKAQIAELIKSSSDGYETIVGERGVRLSGGQRQRIGLARALYKKAELLVLDEATSALDNQTEAEVMEAIEGLDRNITVIIIAHRLSTVQRCDRVVLLDKGHIAGIGSYQDLLQGNTVFQRLARS